MEALLASRPPAEVNTPNAAGETALMWAAGSGHELAVKETRHPLNEPRNSGAPVSNIAD